MATQPLLDLREQQEAGPCLAEQSATLRPARASDLWPQLWEELLTLYAQDWRAFCHQVGGRHWSNCPRRGPTSPSSLLEQARANVKFSHRKEGS